jgi:membrane-bound hydrogenase subunit beta
MTPEETLKTELAARFPYLADKVRVQRARRLWVEVEQDHFAEVFGALYRDFGFTMLPSMTGLDLGERLGLVYHLAQPTGMVLNVQTSVPKDKPVIQTVSGTFPAADAYEREVCDLLGFQVQGLGEGPRYPLPDDWPAGQYPLRKDWKKECLNPAPAGEGDKANG